MMRLDHRCFMHIKRHEVNIDSDQSIRFAKQKNIISMISDTKHKTIHLAYLSDRQIYRASVIQSSRKMR